VYNKISNFPMTKIDKNKADKGEKGEKENSSFEN